MPFDFPIISADSHITEPGDCYSAHIDPAYREEAPHLVDDPFVTRIDPRSGAHRREHHRCHAVRHLPIVQIDFRLGRCTKFGGGASCMQHVQH